jgi:hypothetical protein
MRCHRILRGVVRSAVTIAILCFGMTLAGSATTIPGTNDAKVEQLELEVQKQRAMLDRLLRRLENLDTRSTQTDPPSNATGGRSERDSSSEPLRDVNNQSAASEATNPSRPEPINANTSVALNPVSPGQFQISADDAERALERTLTATGNLLVPYGLAEVEPQFSYNRREVRTSVLFSLNRNEFEFALATRLGLPWESQFEISVPYHFAADHQLATAFVSPAQQVANRWGNSFGDVTLGFAKTFLHESGLIPDLLGRISYTIPIGAQSDNHVSLPGGHNAASFALTALKRQDPLVFVGTAGYTKEFGSRGFNPGDQINFQLGAFLAASPETSLRGVLQQSFFDDAALHGVRIPGSGGVQSVLKFGGSSILYRGILLDLQVGVGLTEAAPKYSVTLSSTYRFGVP